MCTERTTIQDTASPWTGILYCIEEPDTPTAFMLNGVWNEGLREVASASGERITDDSPEGQVKILSDTKLSLPIPYFSDRTGSMNRFSTFRCAGRQQEGIIAVGRWDEYCIVAVRIPERDRPSIGSVDSTTVEAVLSDGPVLRDCATIRSRGFMYQSYTSEGLKFHLIEKAILSQDSYLVKAAPYSKILTMRQYVGPATVFAPRDWKLVFAFDYLATGQILFAVRVGYLRLQFPPGMVEYGFAKQFG
jgi:hypothetical protein